MLQGSGDLREPPCKGVGVVKKIDDLAADADLQHAAADKKLGVDFLDVFEGHFVEELGLALIVEKNVGGVLGGDQAIAHQTSQPRQCRSIPRASFPRPGPLPAQFRLNGLR